MGPLNCTPNPIFSPATYSLQDVADVLPAQALELCRLAALQLPPAWAAWLSTAQVVMKPIDIHAMILAAFASLVAPFGACV
jgi:phosphatidate cytidylyltransferase